MVRINIWSDAWVPSIADRKIITPRGHGIISKVCDLIDPVTGQCGEELVNETFSPVDVQYVTLWLFHLPHIFFERSGFARFIDFAWSFNKNDVSSVRSAYHVEWNHQHSGKLRRTTGLESMGPNGI